MFFATLFLPLFIIALFAVVFLLAKNLTRWNIHTYVYIVVLLLFLLSPILYYLMPGKEMETNFFPVEYEELTEDFFNLAELEIDSDPSSYLRKEETIELGDPSPLLIETYNFSLSLLYIERVADLDNEMRVYQYDAEDRSEPFYVSYYTDEWEETNHVLHIGHDDHDPTEVNLFKPSFITSTFRGDSLNEEIMEEAVKIDVSEDGFFYERPSKAYKQGIHIQIPADLEIQVPTLNPITSE
ncbi:energy-coupling factor transporter transmembrane protein EcfT [Alkalihalobacillus xiaoxiensis]|uniref:Energy-coupling factor transporter transmembrane protein EcfT n=1 Tax=Shouchella xiaoxiensis TaxID=766895 RepID=A0ABS2SZN6_9BACI|nr:hypothetical protein [Shouchella xiaoxiensis]MBM7840994.1 energy-coupling factor transporter transmembrane protein EcfT [Shouchella xiaoxiensis]